MLIQVKSLDLFKEHLSKMLANGDKIVYLDSGKAASVEVLVPAEKVKPPRYIRVKLLVITPYNSLYFTTKLDTEEISLDDFKNNLLNIESAHGFKFVNQTFSVEKAHVVLG